MYEIYDTINKLPILIVIAVLVSLFLGFQCLGCLFSKKEALNETIYFLENEYNIKKPLIIIVCLVCCFVMIFSDSYAVWVLDGKTDIRTAPEGTYCYYVIARRDDSSKQYTLPAKINKLEGDYFVENIYFSNGGYLYFNSYEYSEYGETIRDADQDGDFWEIKLTNRKAYHSSVTESYSVNFWRMFLLIVSNALIMLYAIILLFSKNNKQNA